MGYLNPVHVDEGTYFISCRLATLLLLIYLASLNTILLTVCMILPARSRLTVVSREAKKMQYKKHATATVSSIHKRTIVQS